VDVKFYPLHTANYYGDLEMILKAGVDISIKDFSGKTASDYDDDPFIKLMTIQDILRNLKLNE
jgi:hypothetical protein